MKEEISAARAEAVGLEDAAETMARELRDSERRAEETERKALGVARELLETSEAIARLREEAAVQDELCEELEDARREEGMLEQWLEATQTEVQVTPDVAIGEQEATQRAFANATRRSRTARRQEARCGSPPASQDQAMSDALRAAWEAEARERRQTDLEIEALEAKWLPLREWLMRISVAAGRYHQELVPTAGGDVVLCPYSDSAWCDDARIPELARSVCSLVEDVATESIRRLSEAQRKMTCANSASSPQHPALAPWPAPPVNQNGEVSSLSASPLSQGRHGASASH